MNFNVETARELMERLPNRSIKSIISQARRMKLKKQFRWTEKEVNNLANGKAIDGRSSAAIRVKRCLMNKKTNDNL